MRLLLASLTACLLLASTASAQYDTQAKKKKSETVYTASILGVGG